MNKLHQDDVRRKIQVSQLINVLTKHAIGETEELSQSRIKAIEILLRKSLPDLSSVELTGEGGGPLQAITRIELVPLDDSGSGKDTA